MELKKLKEELIKDPEFAREYYKKDLAFDIGNMVIEARISRGITQTQLAKIIGTKQPGIARLERGESMPSLSLLDKVAKALGTNLSVYFSKKNYVFDIIETIDTDSLVNNEKITTYFPITSFSETSSVIK